MRSTRDRFPRGGVLPRLDCRDHCERLVADLARPQRPVDRSRDLLDAQKARWSDLWIQTRLALDIFEDAAAEQETLNTGGLEVLAAEFEKHGMDEARRLTDFAYVYDPSLRLEAVRIAQRLAGCREVWA